MVYMIDDRKNTLPACLRGYVLHNGTPHFVDNTAHSEYNPTCFRYEEMKYMNSQDGASLSGVLYLSASSTELMRVCDNLSFSDTRPKNTENNAQLYLGALCM